MYSLSDRKDCAEDLVYWIPPLYKGIVTIESQSSNPRSSKEFRRGLCQALTKPWSNKSYHQMPLQVHQRIACSRSGVSCMAFSMCACLWGFACCSNLSWLCQCMYEIAITAPMRVSLSLPLLPAREANPCLSHARRKHASIADPRIAR